MSKVISIAGCTGSIGMQAIDVCMANGFYIETLTANKNVKLLAENARKVGARYAVIGDESLYNELKLLLNDTNIRVRATNEEIANTIMRDGSSTVLNSVVGIAGLETTIATIKAGKILALANKESLVAGGELVMELAEEKSVEILPVDSEHSAIFQCLNGESVHTIDKVLLTASGGPFRGYSSAQLKQVTKAEALKHPNWEMGAKITIDSSTLMNKGLEFIEAMHLFSLTPEQIEVVVHKQSIVHSAVEFVDGSVIAQLGASDMRLPIQYALTYPERLPCNAKRMSLFDVAKLDFEKPDLDTFLCLKSAIEAAKKGTLYTAALNGANEEIVAAFLADKAEYYDIFEVAEGVVGSISLPQELTLENIYLADKLGREYAKTYLK